MGVVTSTAPFTWHDGERVIAFGRGRTADAVGLLGGPGYVLLTTERAARALPALADAACSVLHVEPGRVDELAEALLPEVGSEPRLAALGGGRVIDTAKALVAARGGRVLAVPTTLSGAEMTKVHRHATSTPAGTPGVRPAVVVNDPELCASQPEPELAASALNALAHAVEGPLTPLANPVARLAAGAAIQLIDTAFAGAGPVGRDGLALGALLAGYTIDSTGYGLHHVLAQTLVRVGGASHGAANAVLLPHTMRALATRGSAADPALAERILAITTATRISQLGVDRALLADCADAAAQRGELHLTPPVATRAEILAIYAAAW